MNGGRAFRGFTWIRAYRGVPCGRAGGGGRTIRQAFLIPLAALAACGDGTPLDWCAPAGEGIEVVASVGPGAWNDRRAARLQELWRAGGLNEREELVYPVALAASPTGRLAIPDFQLSEVVVVEPDGTWRGPWGRRGKGPGELATPVAATWDRAGRLSVFDLTAPKVLFLEEGAPAAPDLPVEGSFTATIVLSGELRWAGVQPQGAVLVQPVPTLAGDGAGPGAREALLLRLAPGASAPDTVARATVRTLGEDAYPAWAFPGAPRLLSAVGTDGALAVAAAEAGYRIVLHDSAGTPVRQICRQAEPLPVSDRERGEGADEFPEDLVTAVRSSIPADPPQPFGRLFWGARGRLWVQRDRPSPVQDSDALFGPPGGLYDIFDEAGRFLGEVRAPPRARLQSAAGDTVYGFEFGNLDEVWVVAYRLVRD